VLAASSPVFDVMLYPNAGEVKGDAKGPLEIKVPTITVDTFSQLLRCIYTDKVS
jgi:hypothetical protein